MIKPLDILSKSVIYIAVISAPIQWINLITIGKLGIKFIDLTIIPIAACLFFKSFRINWVKFINNNAVIIYSFLLLMAANYILSVYHGRNLQTGFAYITKNTFYLFYFTLFGAVMILRTQKENFYKEVAISNTACVLFFLIVVTIIFRTFGRNFLLEIFQAFIKGDSQTIRYDLFLKLFNSTGGDEEFRTSLRNTLVGVFIYIHFTSIYSFLNCKEALLKTLNIVNILFAAFIILASTSRSNMVVLILGYLIAGNYYIITGKIKFKPIYFVGICSLLFFTLIFFDKVQSSFGGSAEMVGGRLEQLQGDARWDLNAEAGRLFLENFFTGLGSGVTLSNGLRVHNFILGSACQAGILGLALSLIFYFAIIYSLFTSVQVFSSGKGLFWITSIVMLPLLRAMTSGNSGTLSIIEWFCLAFFLAMIYTQKNSFQKSLITTQFNPNKTSIKQNPFHINFDSQGYIK